MLDELFESERTKMLAVRVCGRRVVAGLRAGWQGGRIWPGAIHARW